MSNEAPVTPKKRSAGRDLPAAIAVGVGLIAIVVVTLAFFHWGFILLVAFNKPLLATRLGEGVTTVGMPLGLGVILFTILITGIYVQRANSEFDKLSDDLNKAVLK